jgi:hypothetical protein
MLHTQRRSARRIRWRSGCRCGWLAALWAPFALAGLGAFCGASAQGSSELPAKPFTAAQPVTAEEIRFSKGKGRRNSYLSRFEEDYAYLRDPAKSTDFFDPLKFIALDPAGGIYLTLNGETRFRYDNTDHRNFSVATAATPATTPGGTPTLTPAVRTNTNQLYKQRYALGGDLHLGENLRFYGDLYHGQQTGQMSDRQFPATSATSSGW